MEQTDESVRRIEKLPTKREITPGTDVQLKNVELLELGRRIRRARKLLGFIRRVSPPSADSTGVILEVWNAGIVM
jgi:hypothetical protein